MFLNVIFWTALGVRLVVKLIIIGPAKIIFRVVTLPIKLILANR
jgi:hypothetical protein